MYFVYNKSGPCRLSFKLVFIDFNYKGIYWPFALETQKGCQRIRKKNSPTPKIIESVFTLNIYSPFSGVSLLSPLSGSCLTSLFPGLTSGLLFPLESSFFLSGALLSLPLSLSLSSNLPSI